MSRRMSHGQLVTLAGQLSTPERGVIETVARLHLMTHAQLAVLVSDDRAAAVSRARSARRLLAHLTELRILGRLERRIGGRRAGSAGFSYYLGPAGQRVIAYWRGDGLVRGRLRPEPGGRYVRHRLAVSDLYVQLVLAERSGQLELLGFDAEPDCWRSYVDGFGGRTLVKPDAFARLGLGAYEDSFFVEVDLASESRPVLARKLRAYVDYFQSGHEQTAHGVFPRVLVLTTSEERRAVLVELCARLPADVWKLFTIATLDRSLEVLTGQIDKDARVGGEEAA
jgi:hypothetical protein